MARYQGKYSHFEWFSRCATKTVTKSIVTVIFTNVTVFLQMSAFFLQMSPFLLQKLISSICHRFCIRSFSHSIKIIEVKVATTEVVVTADAVVAVMEVILVHHVAVE